MESKLTLIALLTLSPLPAVLAAEFPVFNDVTELIRFWGYPAEDHWVTTADGYILNYNRIPKAGNESKGVVFLQHGLFGSSSRFVAGPADKSLGYILSDAGYDVWLGNTRGNTYSRNHTTLDPDADADKDEFWDFEWEDAGLYDLEAGLSYVLEQTGEEQLIYIGHSMGTSQFLAAASLLFIVCAHGEPLSCLGPFG